MTDRYAQLVNTPSGACSSRVANDPQSGQRPSQRACSPPHSLQT